MANMVKLQMGKLGLTSRFIENLRKIFLNAEHVRIGLLKSATRDKEEAKKMAERIVGELGKNYTFKIIGYTLALRKWRKARV